MGESFYGPPGLLHRHQLAKSCFPSVPIPSPPTVCQSPTATIVYFPKFLRVLSGFRTQRPTASLAPVSSPTVWYKNYGRTVMGNSSSINTSYIPRNTTTATIRLYSFCAFGYNRFCRDTISFSQRVCWLKFGRELVAFSFPFLTAHANTCGVVTGGSSGTSGCYRVRRHCLVRHVFYGFWNRRQLFTGLALGKRRWKRVKTPGSARRLTTPTVTYKRTERVLATSVGSAHRREGSHI